MLRRLEVVSAGELVEDTARKAVNNRSEGFDGVVSTLKMATEPGIPAGIRNFMSGQFYSCFVSYSHTNGEFALQLNSLRMGFCCLPKSLFASI